MRSASHYHSRTRDDLTGRQRDVLALVAKGKTNREIAEALGMTLDGAKFHVSEILSKLGVSTREEAAAWWKEQHGVKSRAVRGVAWLTGSWRWLAVGGSALALATVAVVVLAVTMFGGETPTPSPVPSSTPSGETTLAPCNIDDVTFQLGAAPQTDGVELILDASGTEPCRLAVVANLALRAMATMDPAVEVPDLNSLDRTFTLTRDFPSSGTFAEWDWANWCGTTAWPFSWQLDLAGTAGDALARPIMLEVPKFPPCRDTDAPGTLTLRNATTGVDSPALACPEGVPSGVCAFAFDLATALGAPDTISRLVQAGTAATYTCAENGTTTQSEFTSICAGRPAGSTVEGFHLAMHGSEGQTLSPAGFTKALQDELDTIVPQLATIGCTVISARCIDFVVAFATGKRTAAVYLAFETRPGGAISLTGAGLSGDNAPTILTGGRTMSVIGETNFVPVNPAP